MITTTLNEHKSKEFLRKYNIPATNEIFVKNEKHAQKHAIAAANKIGYPIVIKGLSSSILHKTEKDLVYLNIYDDISVSNAIKNISKKNLNIDGYLVQPHIKGNREFIAGLLTDEVFGPVIMFGIGGIYTNALSDISFRLAPVNDNDIHEMLDELISKEILKKIRNEKKVCIKQITKVLKGLSQISIEHRKIVEIDINPLIADSSGNLTAVDALIVSNNKSKLEKKRKYPNLKDISKFFHPKTIAFVGASAKLGKWGFLLPVNTISGGFKGEMFFVNPKGEKIFGQDSYRSITEIKDDIDLAVVTIPAENVLDLMYDFKKKNVKNVLLITSGFGETGKKGKILEKEIIKLAKKFDILILGPNTMGICNPHINFYCTGINVNLRPGATAIVSQSGNMGTQFLSFAEKQDIGVRGFCGSGNESMITIEDFLDAFENDDLTKTIMLYIESVKDGKRFFKSASRVSKKKPIVLLKGGQSKAGLKAAQTHTGAMATNSKIFNAMCKQAGIVKVEQPMDLLDLSAAFSSLPLPKGNRVAVMTLGGGWGVVTADLCEKYNLKIPNLCSSLYSFIDKMLPDYWSKQNPIDLVGEHDISMPLKIMEELLKWEKCDAVINLGILGRRIYLQNMLNAILKVDANYSEKKLAQVNSMHSDFEEKYIISVAKLMEKYDKPVYGVSLLTDSTYKTVYRIRNVKYKSIFYTTPEQAVKACAKMYEYQCYKRKP